MKSFPVVLVIWACTLFLAAGGVSAAGEDDAMAQMKANLKKFANITPDSISPAHVEGLYEIVVGPRLYYVSKDGRFLVQGRIFDLKTQEDVTESRTEVVTSKLAAARVEALEGLGEENMLVFAPKQTKHTVTVFTDTNCTYCRKLHKQMKEYNDLGIKVRYLMYPLRTSMEDTVSIWCAKNPQEALTRAKAGGKIEKAECDNPVMEHVLLGRKMNITGTPAIITEDGRLIEGYLPPPGLLKRLELEKAKVARK